MAESEEELKRLLMKVNEESEKVGLKIRSLHLTPSLHDKSKGKKVEVVTDLFYFLGLRNYCRW